MSQIRRASGEKYEDPILVEPDGWVRNTGLRLREIVKQNPGLKLPGELLDRIAAFDRRSETQSSSDSLVDEVMEAGLRSASGIAFSREQVIFGLDMINSFFVRGRSAHWLVRSLRFNLLELDNGVTPQILRPVRLKNRPPDSRFVKNAKVEAAAVCESLIRRGMTQRRAAEKVAYVLNKHRMSLQVGDVAAKTILQWRRAFRDKIMWLWLPCVIPDWRQSPSALADFEKIVKGWSADRASLLSE
jgi:hypothetical protein